MPLLAQAAPKTEFRRDGHPEKIAAQHFCDACSGFIFFSLCQDHITFVNRRNCCRSADNASAVPNVRKGKRERERKEQRSRDLIENRMYRREFLLQDEAGNDVDDFDQGNDGCPYQEKDRKLNNGQKFY